jgi:hypothetical protein
MDDQEKQSAAGSHIPPPAPGNGQHKTTPELPADLRYTVYASVTEAGRATLWDANATRRDGSFVAGASGDTPAAALAELAKEIGRG